MIRPVTIYSLLDPRDNAVRYIGKTVDVKTRYRQYCSPAECRHHRTHCTCWCLSLWNKGLRPVFQILEVCGDEWPDREQFWIAYGRSLGWKLTNHSVGGESGAQGVVRSPSFCNKVSATMRGRPKSTATKQRIALGHQGISPDETTRRKIGAANHGRSPSPATRQKLRKARLGKKLSPSGKKKVSEAQRRRHRQPWEIERLRWFGRHISDKTRRKMSAAKLGRKMPVAVRRKIQAALQRYWSKRRKE
jgi:hypothetical protein